MPNELGRRKSRVAERSPFPSAPAHATASLEAVAGLLRVRNLTLRPSDLWSPEFNAYYAALTQTENSMREEWPAPERTASKTEWDEFDAWMESRLTAGLLSAVLKTYPVDVLDTNLAGVHVGIVTPKEGVSAENQRRVLINLRGGGFVINRGLTAGLTESAPVASLGRIKVITVDYRQAPFHGYPAATDDVEAVYAHLLREYDSASVGIYGCSAGGCLASQAVARCQNKGLPRPGAVGIFNMAPPPPFSLLPPWAAEWGDSGNWYAGVPKDIPSERDKAMYAMVQWYMERCDINDAEAYPGRFDSVLARFPPTLLLSGTRDFAASTVIAAHARFLKLGVDASLYLMEGAPHAAHVTAVGTPEARAANGYIARWFASRLAP